MPNISTLSTFDPVLSVRLVPYGAGEFQLNFRLGGILGSECNVTGLHAGDLQRLQKLLTEALANVPDTQEEPCPN